MLALLLAGPLAIKHALNGIEGLQRYQREVRPVVLDASEVDFAEVVAVAKKALQAGER